MLTPGDVVERLAGLEPVEFKAVALWRRLQGGESPVELYAEVEAARSELNKHLDNVRRMVQRCRGLRGCPSRQTPIGF